MPSLAMFMFSRMTAFLVVKIITARRGHLLMQKYFCKKKVFPSKLTIG